MKKKCLKVQLADCFIIPRGRCCFSVKCFFNTTHAVSPTHSERIGLRGSIPHIKARRVGNHAPRSASGIMYTECPHRVLNRDRS